MPLFNDFIYNHSGTQVPRRWPAFAANGHWVNPPTANSPRPSEHELRAVNINAAAAHWFASTMGYGAAADYAIHWLLNGMPLGASEIDDLRRLTAARATGISRAYRFAAAAVGPPLQMEPRTIYPLIESSEKGSISYYVGCAMAAICVPRAIGLRPGVHLAGIDHIFHASLLKAASATGKRVVVHSHGRGNVDFVCFDLNLGVHLIEAKGSGDEFTMNRLVEGVEQCLAVVDVELSGRRVAPVSLNVASTYLLGDPVDCLSTTITQSLRCTVVEVTCLPVQARAAEAAAPAVDVLHQLIGAQVLGLYVTLQSAMPLNAIGGWDVFAFAEVARQDRPQVVAVPSQLVAEAGKRFTMGVQAVRAIIARYQAQRVLERVDMPDEEVLARVDHVLVDLGRWALSQNRWRTLDAPQGYERGPAEPWIAFAAPAG